MAEVERGPPEKLIDWLSGWKTSFDRLRNRFGVAVAVLLVLSGAGGLVWWNWEDISKKPGVIDLVSWLGEQPIPKAQPGHLTIALTHLEDDKENQFEKLVEGELDSNDSAEVIKIDRTIPLHKFSEESQSHNYAVTQARDLLVKSGCDILLWGAVIIVNNKSAIRLNWTMASNIESPKQSEKYEINSVSLPSLFQDDLKNIIKLILQSRQNPTVEAVNGISRNPIPASNRPAGTKPEEGTCSFATSGNASHNTITCNYGLTPEQLKQVVDAAVTGATGPLVDHIRMTSKTLGVSEDAAKTLLKIIGEDPNVPDDKLAEALTKIADDYRKLQAQVAALSPVNAAARDLREQARSAIDTGHFQRAHELLHQAAQGQIAAAEDALKLKDKATEDAQMLGAASSTAAEGDVALTERDYLQAAELFGAAVGYVPSGHASDHGGYLLRQADALYRQGSERGDLDALRSSIEVYGRALADYPRSQVPLDWAATQTSLGVALARLGGWESGTARLEEAVAAFRAALEERTRSRVPLDWAATQTSLGVALARLGERESGTARLEEAVVAVRAALEEQTRERVPLQWASAQDSLGDALRALGERESGKERLEEAIAAYRAALEEYTRERAPLDWAMTQANLGAALEALGERESGTARLEEAVVASRASLEERTRERVPLDWAQTQNNLGAALETLGQRESGTARLEEAVAAYRTALDEFTRERAPLQWATTEHNLGNAIAALGERESGTARLTEAVAIYSRALEERTRERVPLDWAASFGNQGVALMLIGDRTNDADVAETAMRQIQTAYDTARSSSDDHLSAYFQAQLIKAQTIRDRLKRP